MLKRCNIDDLWVMKRKLTCTNYFIILEIFSSREHTKNPNAKVLARPDVTFWTVGYHSPEFQLAFHIYYVKYEKTLTCKRISWNSGGGGGGGGELLVMMF